MPRPDSRPYVIMFINFSGSKPSLDYEAIFDEDAAKKRFAELSAKANGEVVVTRELPLNAEIETTPRVTFAPPIDTSTAPKEKKPRAKRSDAGKPRKMANGHDSAEGGVA